MISKIFKYVFFLVKLIFLKTLYFRSLKFGSIFIGLESGSEIKLVGKAKVFIGKGSYIRRCTVLECHNGEIDFGEKVFVNRNCTFVARERIKVGNNCMFGEGVSIYDHDHLFKINNGPFRDQGFRSRPISIGNNVWVGCKVFIGKGVSIGDNVVVAAGSVVTKSIPSNTIYIRGIVNTLS